MGLIPAFIRRRIEHRPNLLKIVDNIGWLFLDKALRMGVGLLVGVWVARYLGPEQFGLLSFASAFVGMFSAVAGLGLQNIVVRDLAGNPSDRNETLGTAALLQLVGSFLAYLMIMVSIFWLRPEDAFIQALVAVLGSIVIVKSSDVFAYWFESQIMSKYVVWIQNGVFIGFVGLKLSLISFEAPLIAFAWATCGETVMAALLMIAIAGWRGLRIQRLTASYRRARKLVCDSWPLLLSGMAVMIYMKIDQIMLGQMTDDKSVGIYSAAVRISEAWYVAVAVFMASVFPRLTSLNAEKSEKISSYIVYAYRIMFWLSVVVALIVSITSEYIIKILFGVDYAGAADVLAIHIWAGVNVAVGSVWSAWILMENKTRIGLYGQLIGAGLNIVFNLILIPKYGAQGAAWGTLFASSISASIAYCIYKPLVTFDYMSRAFIFRQLKN